MEANPYSTLSFNSYPKLHKEFFIEKVRASTWEIGVSYSLLYTICCYTHVQYPAQQGFTLARSFHALHGSPTHTSSLGCHQMSIQK